MSRYTNKQITTYEGGKQYKLNPLLNLRLATASSILGEPKFYNRNSDNVFNDFCRIIDEALDYDFEDSIQFAVELRTVFNMRLNPNFILIRALEHRDRKKFNSLHPKLMRDVLRKITLIPTDLKDQYDLFVYLHSNIHSLPTMLKKSWAERLNSFSRYTLKKYLNKCRLIDLVRISHAHSKDIDEMMQTGTLKVAETEKTWETLRSSGMNWNDIINQIKIPHMALLRNLRGIFNEVHDEKVLRELGEQLVNGVKEGKQFPFRYYAAFAELSNTEHDPKLYSEVLSQCMEKSMDNLPKLKGRTIALADNSGSTFTNISSKSNVMFKDVINISSLMIAMKSDSGKLVCFDTEFRPYNIYPKDFFEQLSQINKASLGGGTVNAVTKYLENAIIENEWIDNLFCFTDDQSNCNKHYVQDVINRYRETVNPKINIFLVQVAGYVNGSIPENLYRVSYLYGWSGKEALFASEIIKIWDEYDEKC